jgi:uncharacterized protein YkwD
VVKIFKRLAAATVLALTVGTFSPATTASAGFKCYRIKDSEKQFAQKMNLARSATGKGKLQLDKQLSRVARRHAWEMQHRNTLFHTPSSTLGWRVTNWVRLGENVGYGGDVASLHRAFMNSPAHRANVMGSYRHVGVGVKKNSNGVMWVTIIFESHADPGTRMKVCR